MLSSEGDELGIGIVEGAALGHIEIVPTQGLLARAAIFLDGVVVAEFAKLPYHLRSRHGEEEGGTHGCTLHLLVE